MTKVKEYLFSIPPGKEGSFCNMLTSYKSLAYIVSSVNEEECRAFVEFSRPTSIPQKKLQDIQVVELLPTREENIQHVKELGEPWMEMSFSTKKNNNPKTNNPKKEELCLLNIYSKLQRTKEDLVQLLEEVDKRIEELHTSD